MRKVRNRIKSLIAVVTVTATLLSSGINYRIANAATTGTNESTTQNEYGLTEKTADGAILHAWDWSFNTIKSRLKDIAEAGYSSIQVSPIQPNISDYKEESKWWVLYQPTDFKIGNTQLGTRDEFKEMCSEAEKYGIKVIVDVVANHTGNRGDGDNANWPAENVASDLKDDPNCWHEHKAVSDWNNRWQVTHQCIGLPDLNTSNSKVQGKVISFLNDCIDCGADGFRFDACKHIELPDDPDGSDFWTNVLGSLKDKDDLFIYGEDLQGGADRFASYANYMNLAASNYGYKVRQAVGFGANKNVGNIEDYSSDGVNADKLVTWVESHDNYANDDCVSTNMNEWQIKMGWALIAARAYSTPLYFDRPEGSGKLSGYIGDAGNDNWKDPDVVAVNKFRNAMEGEGETLRKQSDNVMMIERGDKGAVIVNLDSNTNLDSDTNLPDGTYENKATTGGTFTVSNGKITGKLSAGITVLYGEPNPDVKVSATPKNKSFIDSIDVTLNASNIDSAVYSIDGGEEKAFKDGDVITIGKDKEAGDKVVLTLKGTLNDKKVEKSYTYTKVENLDSTVYFKNTNNWSQPTAYIYNDEGSTVKEAAAWPGVKMTKTGTDLYSYELPEGFGNAKVIFSDNGSNQVPGSGQSGYVLNSGSSMEYADGQWKVYSDEDVSEDTVIYCQKPDGWGTLKAYIYNNDESTVKEAAAWPGVEMTEIGNGLYSYTLPEDFENAKVIFTDGTNQIPGVNKEGFSISKGESKIYTNGNWSSYNK